MIIHEEGIFGLWQEQHLLLCIMERTKLPCSQARMHFDIILCKKPLEGMENFFSHGSLWFLDPWLGLQVLSVYRALWCCQDKVNGPQSRSGGEVKYKGMIHAIIRTIFAEEGLLAIWKALLPRLVRIPPGGSLKCGLLLIKVKEDTYRVLSYIWF